MSKPVLCCILIFVLLSAPSCNYYRPEISSQELAEFQDLTAKEAIELVANEHYNGDIDGLQVEELCDKNYLVKLTYDMGTGLISTANAHLVVNGKIVASLISESGITDDLFYLKVDEYRKEAIDDACTAMYYDEVASLEDFESKTQDTGNTNSIHHDKDGTTYVVTLTYNTNFSCTIQLFDLEFKELQSIQLDSIVFDGVYFEDVNCDGYTDIVVNTGGTLNETHELYIWNATSSNFTQVLFDGFDMLSYFEITGDCIMNWVKDSAFEGVAQKLVWNGSTLTMESEDRYKLDD